ncbi:MAG: glycine cleavage system protein H [Acidobacteria bacterium]|nr:glycine cleavage system protein H [Acidobacteriota bacterium]
MTDSGNFHIPNDRYYDPVNHLWARVDSATGRIVVGLDALGLSALGDLVYVTLQPVGTPVRRGEPVGTLEAAKMTGDLIAPVSGILIGRNELVLRDPSLVNRDPYEGGWIASIDPTSWPKESAELIAGDAIPGWVKAEVERYQAQGWI